MNYLFIATGCFILLLQHILPISSNTQWNEQPYQVTISESSQLLIHGSTNVNRFQCKYTLPLSPEVFTVNARQTSGTLYFSDALIKLQTAYFKSGHPQITRDMQTLLKARQYPYIVIQLLHAELPKSMAAPDSPQILQSNVEITLAGTARRYTIPVYLSDQGEEQILSGELKLNVCDFNLELPKVMFGMITVNEEVNIIFNLKVCVDTPVTIN